MIDTEKTPIYYELKLKVFSISCLFFFVVNFVWAFFIRPRLKNPNLFLYEMKMIKDASSYPQSKLKSRGTHHELFYGQK